MLILTRRMGESLCIGEHVVVTVLAVKGTQVRLGITAPRDVTVDREEVHERKLAKHRTGDGAGAPGAEQRGARPPLAHPQPRQPGQ